MSEQSELNRAAPAFSVKAKALVALRAPHSIVVDMEGGTVTEYRGVQMLDISADAQWVVPSIPWLARMKHAMTSYRQMLDQHAREREAMRYVIHTILDESRKVALEDLPNKPTMQLNQDDEGHPWGGIPDDDEVSDDDEVPF